MIKRTLIKIEKMILNTTYSSKENQKLIEGLVGKPFSLFQRIKLNGIGSKRMMIEKVSPNMQSYMNVVSDITYANIELRPTGILLMINRRLQTFTWVIPYYQLVIYKATGSSIHAQGKFINFRKNQLFRENKSFFDKLTDLKIQYDIDFYSPTMSM